MMKFSLPRFLSSRSTRFWFWLTAALAGLERLWLYVAYRPVTYSDTHSYRRLAEAIRQGWQTYDGTRTPGYPIFLAIAGNDERAYALQLAFGLLTTLLFFYIGWRVSRRGWLGALAACAYTLNPQQLFFEASLITESLTTFLLTASFAGLAALLYAEVPSRWQHSLLALGMGLTSGLAALTRPLFIFLPFWLALFLGLVSFPFERKARWQVALITGVSGLILLGLWTGFIHRQFGRWGLTTMTGYHLIQHTGVFFEYVPDEYAPLRDTYLQYRAARLAETGQPNNAIWEAIPAMQQASGLSFYDLSDVLTKISLQLIWRHPMLYLRNVIEGWFWFWKAPVYWSPAAFVATARVEGARIWIEEAHLGLICANCLFLAGSAALLWPHVRARWLNPFLAALTGMVWLTSLLQTLLDHGDNPRFAVPVQTFILLLVLWWSKEAYLSWVSKRSAKT